ncbi:TonB-dependent receptor [Aestuariibaculum sediminum]|uniref:TonB-dependent receptor n=1 Tax=Aestuariibaculum sediminum TaxID=2770637 RepID=A0A8J6Q693_9FLAO|nr:TonB-dependent receptor [Aestuariibaculum sediminum]MBD0831618.1 TonB-dependent receptor [Aestuariibaculum sediminum]
MKLDNVTIEQVFNKIESISEFRFLYETDAIDVKKNVSLEIKNKKIDFVLEELFRDSNVKYDLLDRQILLTQRQVMQNKINQSFNVSGIVLDNNGIPLPGATILEKGTQNGVQTDFDGKFNLKVSSSDIILVVSFVGFKTQEVEINGQMNLSISLEEDTAKLEEVVITGYGSQKRTNVTTAISQIKGDNLVKVATPTLGTSLTGQVPGLLVTTPISEPGNDTPTILVRGLSTITGANAPLIVIDGVANADGINRLDPNDIESVTVLKDASAAIYGAQSAGGVILITTKRGEIGKPKFNFSTGYGFVSPISVPKYSNAALQLKGLGFSEEVIEPWLDGTNKGTDWLDEVLKNTSGQQRHSLTASGGSETVNYFASLGYVSQEGQVTGDNQSGNKQYNFRSNIDAKLSDRLKLSFDVSGRRQDRVLLARSLQDNIRNTGLTTPLQPAYVQGMPTGGRVNQSALIVAKSEGNRKDIVDVLGTTIRLDYDIPKIDGLTFKMFGNIVTNQQYGKDWLVPFIYYDEDANGNLIEYEAIGRPVNRPQLTERFDRSTSLTYNARFNYSKNFGLHNIDAFIAYEQYKLKSNFIQAQRLDFDSTAVPELFAGTTDPNLIRNNGSSNESARQNYFGQISYDYDGKYLFQFHLRRDASERFSENERVGYFPGISAGWLISKEEFFNVSFIEHLKLRSSWGILGNDAIGRFNYLSLYEFAPGYVFDGSLVVGGNREGLLAAPNTTWEKKETRNLGFEFGMFDRKLFLELDFFKYITSDILISRNATVTDVSGIGSQLPNENLGEFENKGFEIQTTYRNNIGDFNYNISANFSRTKNETIFIDEPDFGESRIHQSREGRPWGTPLMYVVEGRFLSQADIDDPNKLGLGNVQLGDWIYRDINNDGIINVDDRVISDYNEIPQIIMGLNISASYKGFDLTVNTHANAKVKKFTHFYIAGEINNTAEYYFKNLYYNEAEPGTIPALNRGRDMNSVTQKDASFVRIKTLELGYTIPNKYMNKIGLDNARIYANGYNLFTFSKFNDYQLGDPEAFVSGSFHYQPSFKTITIGLNLGF